MFKSIFANEEVNTGRQRELDRAKCVLILCLAIVHFYIEATDPDIFDIIGSVPYFWDSIVGGPFGAPVFIFAMGIGLQYSRSRDPKFLFKRGLSIGLVAIFLNVFRYLVPSLVGYAVTGNYDKYISKLPYRFFGNDILQFACLAMILMSLFLYLKLNPYIVFVIALVMNMASMLVNNIDFGNIPVNIIMGHFIGVEDPQGSVNSDFPVLMWFLMYAAGSLFGHLLRRVKNKNKLYLIISPISAVIVIPVLYLECAKEFGMMGGSGWNVFYHMNTLEMLVCICVCLLVLGVYQLMDPIIPEKVTAIVEFISREITNVYVIQWILVWWIANVFMYICMGQKYLGWVMCLIIGIGISLASVLIAYIWKNKITKSLKGTSDEEREKQ